MRAFRQKRSGSRSPYTQPMTTLLLWPLRPPAVWVLGLFILLGWLLLAAVDLFDDLVPMALALIIGFGQLEPDTARRLAIRGGGLLLDAVGPLGRQDGRRGRRRRGDRPARRGQGRP